jgi:hypothetical protein
MVARPVNDVTAQRGNRSSGVTIFWAIVRMIFGILQMTGAIASAALLFRGGVSKEALVAVSLTMVITLISITLFKWLKVQETGRA